MNRRLRVRGLALIRCSEIDKTARILSGTRFYYGSMGGYSYVGRFGLIQSTSIGRYCSISDACMIGLPGHPTDWISTSPIFHSPRNVFGSGPAELPYAPLETTYIGNDVWLGARVLVKAGVTIGDGAVVGGGSIVTRDVPAFSVVAGNPARVIRYRFTEPVRNEIVESRWWDKTPEELAPSMNVADNPLAFLRSLELLSGVQRKTVKYPCSN